VTRSFKSIFLTCAWPILMAAQESGLHIAVTSGEGAVHTAGTQVMTPAAVELTNSLCRPVEGARVSFQVPAEGPSGVFTGGLATHLAVTDSSGRAAVSGFHFNRIPGQFSIRVTAVKDKARAGIVVKQSITPAAAITESAGLRPPEPEPAKTKPLAVSARTPEILTPRPVRVQTIVLTPGGPKPSQDTGATHKSHKKWIWLAVLASGGVAGALAGSSLGRTAAAPGSVGAITSFPSASVGIPAITVGKP